MTTAFEKRCRKVAEDMDIGIDFYDDDSKAGAHEDDGTLHVVWRGSRKHEQTATWAVNGLCRSRLLQSVKGDRERAIRQ